MYELRENTLNRSRIVMVEKSNTDSLVCLNHINGILAQTHKLFPGEGIYVDYNITKNNSVKKVLYNYGYDVVLFEDKSKFQESLILKL